MFKNIMRILRNTRKKDDIIINAMERGWKVAITSDKHILLYKDCSGDDKKVYINTETGNFTVTTKENINTIQYGDEWVLTTHSSKKYENEYWFNEINNIIYKS